MCILGYIGGGGTINEMQMAMIRCLYLARKLIVKKCIATNPQTHIEWLKAVDIIIRRDRDLYTLK